MVEEGDLHKDIPKSTPIMEVPIDLEFMTFHLGLLSGEVTDKQRMRASKENVARQEILQNILDDREEPPLSVEEIKRDTRKSRKAINKALGEDQLAMFGIPTSHSLVFEKEKDKYTVAHFFRGELQTLSQINLSSEENPLIPKTRVVFTETHEGRIESSLEPGYDLTNTAVKTFNFFVGRGVRAGTSRKSEVPAGFVEQIRREEITPKKMLLREELFNNLNQHFGEPLKNGGVFIITDTSIGSPLGALRQKHSKFRTPPNLGEIDDFMQILLVRSDTVLSEKVKAIGHTSRGSAFTEATVLAANIGNMTESKPVFPGYHPYLQHNEESDPVRISPTALAVLELARAHSRGKDSVLVDEAPTTNRVYETIINLAKERGVDISRLPVVFSVGVKVEDGKSEIIDDTLLNYNYSMGEDCKDGMRTALGHFDNVTLFSYDVANVAFPLTDFVEFVDYMKEAYGGVYQEIAKKMLLRAEHGSSLRSLFEDVAKRKLGKKISMPANSFPAQDTILGAYIAHPEWFEVKETTLRYAGMDGIEKDKKITTVINMTNEGRERFPDWVWRSIRSNFAETEQSGSERDFKMQKGLTAGVKTPYDDTHTSGLLATYPELVEYPDIVPTFDVVNPGHKTAVVRFRGLNRRPADIKAGDEEFVNWYSNMFPQSVRESVTFIHVNYPQHTYVGELITRQAEDFIKELGVEEVHIVGGSYGGVPAFELASDIETRNVDVDVKSIALITGVTNLQEVTSGANVGLGAISTALEVPKRLGLPTGYYAHARAVGVRLRGIPEKPYKPDELPTSAKVKLVCAENDRIVNNEELISNTKKVFPDTEVSFLKGWHAIAESERTLGNRMVADFITKQLSPD